MATKAIHIEAVSDMTSHAFIAAFKRFTARRGLCHHLYSDCGTNFVGAKKILDKDISLLLQTCNQDIADSLASDGTTWHFNPPSAPHFGGLWEAGVKSMKHHLKRIIGETILTFEELTTVLSQIEACLNSRPICPLSDDPTDTNVLTPGHFLMGRAPVTPPESQITEANMNYLTRWKLVSKLYKDFWTAWSGEYLSRLQQRPKWRTEQPNVSPRQLVLIKEDNIPASRWPLARVVEVHPGRDGIVRVVSLLWKGNNIIKRPITKICPLPVDSTAGENNNEVKDIKCHIVTQDSSNQHSLDAHSYETRTNLKRESQARDPSLIQEKRRCSSPVYNQINKMLKEHSKTKRKGPRIRPVSNYSTLIPLDVQQRKTEEYRAFYKRYNTNERPTKRVKRNDAFINNNPLIICLFLLFLAKFGRCAYNITHPQPGLYVENIGDAMIRKGTLRLALAYPTNITKDVGRVNSTITKMKNICTTTKEFSHEIHCDQLVQHLIQKQNTLLGEIAVCERKIHKRIKRGILGKLLQSIFGVNDEIYTDIDTLNQNQQMLRETMQQQSTLLLSTMKTINNTENKTIHKMNMITSKLNKVIEEINNAQGWFNSVDKNKANIHILASYHLASEMILEIEEHYIKLVKVTMNEGSLFDFITPGQLMDIVVNTSAKIPANLQLSAEPDSRIELVVNDTDVYIYGYLHIVSASLHTLNAVTPIPRRLDDFTYVAPDISTSMIATSYNTQTYFELTENEFSQCRFQGSHLYLCSPTVVSNIEANPNCVVDEIYHRHERIQCTWKRFSTPSILWKRLHMKNTWLFVSNRPNSAAIKCNGIREDTLLNGTGIIRIDQGCTIETKKNILTSELISTIPVKSTYAKPINIDLTDITYSKKPEHLDPEPVLKQSDQFSGLNMEQNINFIPTWKIIGHHAATGTTAIVTSVIFFIVIYKLKTCRSWTTKSNSDHRPPQPTQRTSVGKNSTAKVESPTYCCIDKYKKKGEPSNTAKFIIGTPHDRFTDDISPGENV